MLTEFKRTPKWVLISLLFLRIHRSTSWELFGYFRYQNLIIWPAENALSPADLEMFLLSGLFFLIIFAKSEYQDKTDRYVKNWQYSLHLNPAQLDSCALIGMTVGRLVFIGLNLDCVSRPSDPYSWSDSFATDPLHNPLWYLIRAKFLLNEEP